MKILILRFSSIGDIVLTTPVMRCIKKQYPDHELHYATKAGFKTLLEFNPYIDKIHTLDKDLGDLIDHLKSEKFDLILDLHKNIRTKRIKTALKVKSRSLDKINWEKWLMVMFKINILPYEHIVDRYLHTADELHVENDGEGLDFFMNPDTELQDLHLPPKYTVYAIGGQHATKQLPYHKQIELLETIEGPVYLIGGKEDMEAGRKLAESAKNTETLCGALNIHQSALLMKNSERIYTHDTGMMHIAAALQKPISSIWGNTIPEFGMSPYYGNHKHPESIIFEVPELDCRPCSKIGYKTCPKGHFDCMELQEFGRVEQ